MTTVRRGAATSKAAFTRAFEVESGKWGVGTPPQIQQKLFTKNIVRKVGGGGYPQIRQKSYFGEEEYFNLNKGSVSLPDAEQFNVPKMSLLLRNR